MAAPNYYIPVYNHKGLNVCVLKNVSADNKFDYVIDHPLFNGQTFKLVKDACSAIDEKGGEILDPQ